MQWIAKHYHGEDDYFEFAFTTGVRCPNEIVELHWGDVGLKRGEVRIRRARVLGETKDTKMHRERIVILSARARAALERERSHTQLASAHIFTNPNTGKPYPDDQITRRRLRAACKALDIRERDAYNTRHSFATWAIMAGANPAWVSAQMGNSVTVLMKRYARGIRDAGAERREVDKLDSAFAPKLNGAVKQGTGA